jgi:flagellar biosynthesis protein FlhG
LKTKDKGGVAPVRERETPFVLVTGGKGGVGKTVLAANLATELASCGFRVLVVDLDLGLANLNMLFGLRGTRTIEDALAGRCTFDECVTGAGGVDVLPASSGTESMGRLDAAARQVLLAGVSEIASDYDVVVGDSAAGIGPDVLDFARAADRVLVVTTPDVTAITDAYGLIKALDQYGSRIDGDIPTPEIVVNFASGVEEGKAIAGKLQAVCERFLSRSPRQAGWLPRSTAVARSVTSQEPFARGERKGLEKLCLRQIASRLSRPLRDGDILVNTPLARSR